MQGSQTLCLRRKGLFWVPIGASVQPKMRSTVCAASSPSSGERVTQRLSGTLQLGFVLRCCIPW